MAYVVPTPEEFYAEFPSFSAVNDVVVRRALERAGMRVDDTWVSQEDFTRGRFLLAAHYLTLDGHGTGTEAELAASGALGFASIRSGQLSLTRSESSLRATPGTIRSTSYGEQFYQLTRLNHPSGITV